MALALACAHSPAQEAAPATGPAPPGNAKTVAANAIKEAQHPCPKVSAAMRLSDGSVAATCSNGEYYRIYSVDAHAVAMRCSAAGKLAAQNC